MMKKLIKKLKVHKMRLLVACVFLMAQQSLMAQCNIENLTYVHKSVLNNEITICYLFDVTAAISETYEVLYNDEKIKTANYAERTTDNCFTIKKEEFLSENIIKVQDATEKTCQTALKLDLVFGVYANGNFGGCYSNFSLEKLSCSAEGTYFVKVHFDKVFASSDGSFALAGNNEPIGNFKYSDLPLEIGPFKGDQQIDLTFNDLNEYCGGNITFLSGACANTVYPCVIENLKTEQLSCPDKDRNIYLNLDFEKEDAPSEAFYLYYYYEDSRVDSFLHKYNELPFTIGPFIGDGRTSYGICVADSENLDCKSHNYINELSCVIPGNADGKKSNIVNNADLLKVGEAFGAMGTEREAINLEPHPTNIGRQELSSSWDETFKDGLNYKHADCNGDGVVNRKDALVIKNNYSFDEPAEGEYNYLDERIDGTPMAVKLPYEKVSANTTVELPIILGTEASPVEGLYGIAFSLALDTNVVSIFDIEVDFENSWLGEDGDPLLTLAEFNPKTGKMDIAITKTNSNSIYGFGNIANLRIIILIEIEPEKRFSKYFSVAIENVLISTKSEGYEYIVNKGVNIQSDKAAVMSSIKSTQQLPQNIQIYPTIANDVLHINTTNKSEKMEVKIYDVIGNTIYQCNDFAHLVAINTSNWNPGIYFVNFLMKNRLYNKRILIKH